MGSGGPQVPDPLPEWVQDVVRPADMVGTTLGASPFVMWMQLDAAGVVHTHAGIWSPFGGWRNREVATGVLIRDMAPAGAASWRIYATPADGTAGVGAYRLTAGTTWRYEATIATPRPVQRIEVIDDYRDPARILATGASSARDVSVADGDIYVAGRPKP